jgi:RHS repeat-associated protein
MTRRPQRVLLALVGLGLVAWPTVTAQQGRDEGQTVTPLTDGRRVIVGGTASGAPVGEFVVIGRDGQPLHRGRLGAPRAWHAATVLPDGTILLTGGVTSAGQLHLVSEILDPERGLVQPIPAWMTPRARHSATLLADGRVVVIGGSDGAGLPVEQTEVIDPVTATVSAVAALPRHPRSDHAATLLADGSIRIAGGRDGQGTAELPDERLRPALDRFVPEPAGSASVGASVRVWPADGQRDVAVDTRVVIQLAAATDPTAQPTRGIRLSSGHQRVPVTVVVAEHGRLLFVTPTAPLAPGTTYTLTVPSMVTVDRPSTAAFETTFTTRADTAPATGPDDAQTTSDDTVVADAETARRSPWRALPPLSAPPGVTALAGQALTLNGQPLADVTLEMEGHAVRTDRTGRFLLVLEGVPSGWCELTIDGRTASRPGRAYGRFEAGLAIEAGRTTLLPYTIWMTALDTQHAVTIPSPTTSEVVVTTPRIPGLELHLPPHTVIRDADGQVVREVTITPIPVDRPPFPLPTGVDVPIYFTIQPGGAYIYTSGSYGPKGAWLVYPNYRQAPPGAAIPFWNYDADDKGWYVYGYGRVDAGGRQVRPDPDVVLYEFTGAMLGTRTRTPPATGPTPGTPDDGDPVDLGTGLFVMTKTDLALPDVLPLVLTRTYRNEDPEVRPFGIGATHPYDLWMGNQQDFQQVDLILPDGGRIHYTRINPGTGIDGIFEHTATRSRFYRSRIQLAGSVWELTLKDGTVFVFGLEAPLQSIRDRFGNTITIARTGGAWGNIARITTQHGRYLDFAYDASDRIIAATDHSGRQVTYQYDASGRLWKVTDAAGGVTEYGYDAAHRMTTIKDPRGIVYLTNAYDAAGRVIRQTQADGGEYEFAYTVNGSGVVTQTDVTNPRGMVRRVVFDPILRYPTSDTRGWGTSDAQTTTYTHVTGTPLVETVTDALTRVTGFTYDTAANVTSVTALQGTANAVTTSYTYEPAYHLVTSVTDPLQHTTTLAYDSLGRLLTVTDPLTHQTSLTWNAAGQVTSIRDPLQQTTTFTYDVGDLVAVTSPRGMTTTRFLDTLGRVVRVTDPTGAVTRLEYTALNQVTTLTDARQGQTTFAYDGNGNLLSLTDARGQTTSYTYDGMDRVATRTDPLLRQETFGYDLMGNLVSWTDRKGQVTTYAYDLLDRQTFVGFGTVGTPPGATYASTIATTWDAGNRATALVDSAAGTIARSYDLMDRLTAETTTQGTVTYTYDAAGRRTTMTVGGQPAVAYGYDAADRLTSVTQGAASVGLTYDAANRRTTLALPNGIVVSYGYDADSQVTALTYTGSGGPLGTLTYTYDAAGRRTSVGGSWARTGLPPALASATYDAANQIATWNGTPFSYDANGNLTSDGATSYTWNARDQLTALTGAATASFTYDATGRRTSRSVAGVTTAYLYDGLDAVQEQIGGTPSAHYLLSLGIDERFARTDGTGTRYYLSDVLQSTVALADPAGSVATTYTYEPYGATTQAGAGSANPARFTGREEDGTGLYYYRARYHDPRRHRFVSEDGLELAGGNVNFYTYVGGSPAQFVDPLGLQLVNGSPRPWWVKPEHDTKPVECVPPGGTYPDAIDGAASPSGPRPGQVLKVPDYTWVHINRNGVARVYTPPPGLPIFLPPPLNTVISWVRVPVTLLPGYGWQERGFTPDTAWNPLFDNAAPPFDGRKPPEQCPGR